jgi:putative transposase
MRDQKKAEAVAEQRMQLLSPLLVEGLDSAKARQIKLQIKEQTGFRTYFTSLSSAISGRRI